jgi:hypothetical protein
MGEKLTLSPVLVLHGTADDVMPKINTWAFNIKREKVGLFFAYWTWNTLF